MKTPHNIRYPINNSEAIHFIHITNIHWLKSLSIPDKRKRCKETLHIIKEVQFILNELKKELDKLKRENKIDLDISEAYLVILKWYATHWRLKK